MSQPEAVFGRDLVEKTPAAAQRIFPNTAVYIYMTHLSFNQWVINHFVIYVCFYLIPEMKDLKLRRAGSK